jgi:superfamily II DNA or RNA helicase
VTGYLTSLVFDQTNARTRARGRAYFAAGAVRELTGDTLSVEAKVQGAHLYEVDIFRFKDDFENSCTCPFFDDSGSICKHIWAVMLAAEEEGYLTGREEERWPTGVGHVGENFPSGKIPANTREGTNVPGWRRQLDRFDGTGRELYAAPARRPEKQLLYLVQIKETLERQKLVLRFGQRERRKDGAWGKIKQQRIRYAEIPSMLDDADRRIVTLLFGAISGFDLSYSYYGGSAGEVFLDRAAWDVLLPLICATGRCFLQRAMGAEVDAPLEWDAGEPWEFRLHGAVDGARENLLVGGVLRRGETEMKLTQPDLLLAGGLIFHGAKVARLNDYGAFGWVGLLRTQKVLNVPCRESDEFLDRFLKLAHRPPLELPNEFAFQEVALQPKPIMSMKKIVAPRKSYTRLKGEIAFDYGGQVIPSDAPGHGIFRPDNRTFLKRDRQQEQALLHRLAGLGFRPSYGSESDGFELMPELLPRAVRSLVAEGWQVEAQGQLFRTPGAVRLEINSGVDWFELNGRVDFGDAAVPLPRLLSALKRREQTVTLDDGSVGVLPEEWLQKYGLLADLGHVEQDHLRFARHQAGLLDALIAAMPDVKVDAIFERLRTQLKDFTGIEATKEPPTFTGELRDYQREGVGWMHFLRRFGFGGCLADDMGLGKTVQALALLEARRTAHGRASVDETERRPALVVAPRSLIFHWKREAERFVPGLRVLDHTGATRRSPGEHFNRYDLILTTYGTLRREALQFKNLHFDYCILDEAQAIKNSATLSAKAARLVRADHRLAMSGTPVENHLGELWSLFEFLNPGMLGGAAVFGRTGRNPDSATRELLSRALRPFILRRTKEQVARELPSKTEQTLYCDLEPRERKLYNELRDFYRARLLKNTNGDDLNRMKFQALEALLRLRQAACHPGLIDKSKQDEPSAKIDTLVAQLDQVLDEGHKALVFSQFTSLLAILRQRLDRAGMRYAYLDGRTRDRETKVRQFQNDAELKLFLISLKAGGLGLNLQAAEYVYLLDPWWNPAVEAQAIDRAHRIGQARRVFAYRLIARETVEEKVLELQRSKRDLADAIITGNNSFVHNLTREDLQLLLS